MADHGNQVQVSALLTHADRKLLDKMASEQDRSRSMVIRRALRLVDDVASLHLGTAEMLGEELGSIHRRLVAEFGSVHMLNKPLEKVDFVQGGCGLRIDDYSFFWHPDRAGVLCAQRGEGDDLEQYQVLRGHLVKVGPITPFDPAMN